MGRGWMETSEVKHNHPLDTDPRGNLGQRERKVEREGNGLLLHTETLGKPAIASLPQTKNVSV